MRINGILTKAISAHRGLKCWQIARRANISDSYLSYLLTGRRQATDKFTLKLAKLLQVPSDFLIIKNSAPSDGATLRRRLSSRR